MAAEFDMARLTHIDSRGRARMVDVSSKRVTARTAVATAIVRISTKLAKLLRAGATPKGDALAVARVAGIMAAKRASELIPLCHVLPLESVDVELKLLARAVTIRVAAKTSAKTGVEMEALAGAAVAALALYDMCKAVDRAIVIEAVQLEEKRGGARGTFLRPTRRGRR